ncbi:MAG: hypothetical protein ACJATT_005871, partial [Myxococcota bacterium]
TNQTVDEEQAVLGNAEVQNRMASQPSEPPPDEAPTRGAGEYVVKRGDTLGDIARRGTGEVLRYTEINFFNGRAANDSDIEPGDVLLVPEGWDLTAMGATAHGDENDVALEALREELLGAADPTACRELFDSLDPQHKHEVLTDPELIAHLPKFLGGGDASEGWSVGYVVTEGLQAVDRARNTAHWAVDTATDTAGELYSWATGATERTKAAPELPEVAEPERPELLEDPTAYFDGGKEQIYGSSAFDEQIGRVRGGRIHGATFDDQASYSMALDDLHTERSEDDATAMTNDQKDMLQFARLAANDAAYLASLESERGRSGSINWSGAMLSNGEFTFNPVLKSRMEAFHRFTYAVGLYTLPTLSIGGESALRNQATAHKWAVEHCIVTGKHSGSITTNLIEMAKANPGGDVADTHGTVWARAEDFVDGEGAVCAPDSETLNRDLTWANVYAFVNAMDLRNNKLASAAEGYDSGEVRLPLPVSGSPYQSSHIKGEALDRDRNSFADGNGSDPLIDYIAWEFGLYRRARGEQWHFELSGRPITEDTLQDDDNHD